MPKQDIISNRRASYTLSKSYIQKTYAGKNFFCTCLLFLCSVTVKLLVHYRLNTLEF